MALAPIPQLAQPKSIGDSLGEMMQLKAGVDAMKTRDRLNSATTKLGGMLKSGVDIYDPANRAQVRSDLSDSPELVMQLDKQLSSMDLDQLQMLTQKLQQAKVSYDIQLTYRKDVSEQLKLLLGHSPESQAQLYPSIKAGLTKLQNPLAAELPDTFDETTLQQFVSETDNLESQGKQLDLVAKQTDAATKAAAEQRAIAEEQRRVEDQGRAAEIHDLTVRDKTEVDNFLPAGKTWGNATREERQQAITAQAAAKRTPTEGSLDVDAWLKRRETDPALAKYSPDRVGYKLWEIDTRGDQTRMNINLRDDINRPDLVLPKEYKTALSRAMSGYPATSRRDVIETANFVADDPEELNSYIRQVTLESPRVGVDLRNQVLGRQGAINKLKEIKTMLKDVPTNILKGTMENVARELGKTSDPRLVQIGTRLNEALIQYRRSLTGVQFSEREADQYAKIFPSYKNEPPVNMAVIDALVNGMESDDRLFWENRLGKEGAGRVGATNATAPPTGASVDEALRILNTP